MLRDRFRRRRSSAAAAFSTSLHQTARRAAPAATRDRAQLSAQSVQSVSVAAAPVDLDRRAEPSQVVRRYSSRDVGAMVFEIPLGDLLASGEPDVVELLAVGDEVAQRADAERLADHMGMQADVHEASTFGALVIKPVEL